MTTHQRAPTRVSIAIAVIPLVAACRPSPVDQPRVTDPPSNAATSSAAPPSSAATVALRTTIPADYPRTILRGSGEHQVDLGTRGTGFFWAPIFLNGSVSKAPGPVYLHIEGVTGAPGSEVDVYLLDQTWKDVDSRLYIGSFTVAVKPPVHSLIVLEVKDFESGDQVRKARSALREMAHFALAMVVKRGSVKVDQVVLTTASESDRIPSGP